LETNISGQSLADNLTRTMKKQNNTKQAVRPVVGPRPLTSKATQSFQLDGDANHCTPSVYQVSSL